MTKLIKIDYEHNKVVYEHDGQIIEEDLPIQPTSKGILRKVKQDENGKLYEVEEIIEFPFTTRGDKYE